MVKRLERIFSDLLNPLFFSAVICAVLFYGGIFKIRKIQFSCLVPVQKIEFIEGILSSSPVKVSSGKFYMATVKPKFAGNEEFYSTAKGKIKIFIPSETVEAIYPGKLLTASKNDFHFLLESGAEIKFSVDDVFSFENGENIFKAGKILECHYKKTLSGKLCKLRALSRLCFKRIMYAWGDAGGLFLALISGAREYTETTVAESFKKSGLSHILALSGMHLSFFGGIGAFFGNKIMKKGKAEFVRLFTAMVFVWFAGLSPSLFRALLGCTIAFLNLSLKVKKMNGLTNLSSCFLIHSAVFPEDIFSAAFILSYGALAGIFMLKKTFDFLLSKIIIPAVSRPLSESAAAQIFTAPVCMALFGEISTAGTVASVVVTPVVNIFIYAGLIGTVLSLFLPFFSAPSAILMNFIYEIISKTVTFFSGFKIIRIL